MVSVLFVCTGNICRSPSGDAILKHLATRDGLNLLIDSVGTHGYHVGDPPDRRAINVANTHGIDMAALRARKLSPSDFERFDYLLAMDNGHLQQMKTLCPKSHQHKLSLFLDHLPGHQGLDVPDPYYGSLNDFEDVFELVFKGCEAFLNEIKAS